MIRFADRVVDAERWSDRQACQSPHAQDFSGRWCADCPHDACCTSMRWADTEGAAHPTNSYTIVTGIPEQDGIVYGVNGVCHQIANRILYPSSQIVSHARGYWHSVSIFGTYGTNVAPSGWLLSSAVASAVAASAAIDWQSRMLVHQRHDHAIALAGGGQQREIDYLRGVRSLYAEAYPDPSIDGYRANTDLHTKELDLMFEYRLGSSISHNRLRALRDHYHRFLLQEPASSPLGSREDGRIDARRVAATINNHFRKFTTEVATLLGPELFERLYAIPPSRDLGLVDSRILARVDGRLAA